MWGSMNLKVTHIQFETTPFTLKEQGAKKQGGCAIDARARTQLSKQFPHNSKGKRTTDIKDTMFLTDINTRFQ